MKKAKAIIYSKVGDNYDTKDPINKLSQKAALTTAKNLKRIGFEEISSSRGESCFVWKQGKYFMASVIECLGTKNLIADEMRKITGETYYDVIAQDTVATFVNDLSTSGAKPLVVHALWAVEDNSFLQDQQRMRNFVKGWTADCNLAGASWGGGETATLKGILKKDTINLAGSCVGIITSYKRLLTENKLKTGDRIVLIKSNGINANGISLARAIAKKLPQGYKTKLADGTLYGTALLTKSNIYAKLVEDLLDVKLDIHYITNITGHGLRKIMRATKNFSYILERIFQPQEIFLFIQKHANLDDYEMYQTYNMGQDYAIFLPEKHVKKALQIITKIGFEGLDAGYVKSGPRKVIIEPKNITFEGKSLDLR